MNVSNISNISIIENEKKRFIKILINSISDFSEKEFINNWNSKNSNCLFYRIKKTKIIIYKSNSGNFFPEFVFEKDIIL